MYEQYKVEILRETQKGTPYGVNFRQYENGNISFHWPTGSPKPRLDDAIQGVWDSEAIIDQSLVDDIRYDSNGLVVAKSANGIIRASCPEAGRDFEMVLYPDRTFRVPRSINTEFLLAAADKAIDASNDDDENHFTKPIGKGGWQIYLK